MTYLLVNGFHEFGNIVRTVDKKASRQTIPVIRRRVYLNWEIGMNDLQLAVSGNDLIQTLTWRKSPATMLKPPFGLALVGLTSGNAMGIT